MTWPSCCPLATQGYQPKGATQASADTNADTIPVKPTNLTMSSPEGKCELGHGSCPTRFEEFEGYCSSAEPSSDGPWGLPKGSAHRLLNLYETFA